MISQITSGSRRAQIHPLLTATCSAIYVYVTSTEGVHACLMDPARLWAVDHSIVERRSGDPVFHVIGCKAGVSIYVDHGMISIPWSTFNLVPPRGVLPEYRGFDLSDVARSEEHTSELQSLM